MVAHMEVTMSELNRVGAGLALGVLLLAGCSSERKRTCGPMRVTIDGQPADLSAPVAVRESVGGEERIRLVALTGPPLTCDELMGRKHVDRDGPVREVSSYVSLDRPNSSGVAVDNASMSWVDEPHVRLVGEAPTLPGGQVSMCVERTEIESVRIEGSWTGSYCGPAEWTKSAPPPLHPR